MTRSPNLVLVEGPDDLHFLLHILYAHGFQRAELTPFERWSVAEAATGARVELKPKNGFEKLAADLHVEITPTHLNRIAVIADADAHPATRWQTIRASLQKAGIGAPSEMPLDGAVFSQPERPIIGVWLMPDNARPGYLEHMVADMIAPEDRLWPYAVECVRSLEPIERRFPPVRTQKAEVHTWLAWQEQPGTRLPEAVVRRYLDTNRPAAMAFVDWFRRWLNA